MNTVEAWARAERVLCIRLDAMGDVLMTTPALRAVKHSRAGRTVTLLTSETGAGVAALVPEVDETVVYDAPWMKSTVPRQGSRLDAEVVERLRRGRFDAAVIFTVYSQNPLPAAFLCHMADIPLRLAHCRENPYQILTDWVPDPEPRQVVRHEVRRQLDLLATVGIETSDDRLSLHVPDGARGKVVALLERQGVDVSRPWVLIHPGSTAPSRRYPAERFTEVADRLALEHGLAVVFTGTASEHELIASIRGAMRARSVSLAGALDLGGLVGLISLTPVLVSNNTGPVHIAAALGTPVVDLYALTNPQHTPWRVPHRVLYHDVPCRYCHKSVCPEGHHDCLSRVPPTDAVEAALALLAGPRGVAPQPRISMPEETWPCTPLESMPPIMTPPHASSATDT